MLTRKLDLERKIKSHHQLKNIIASLKSKKKKIAFTNGCFDILHYGHVKYLQDASKLADVLVVAVNSDASIRKIKGGKRPIINQKDRLRIIAALESTGFVTIFNDDTPLKIIKLIKPDILVKGADWNKSNIVGADFIAQYGAKVVTIKLAPGRSTTNLINTIVKKF